LISPRSCRTVEISDPEFEVDGLRTVTVKSAALGRRADVTVWVPEGGQARTLLLLLHGVYGSHWAWSMKGGVHHTARRMLGSGEICPMVIAMPSDGLGRDGSGYLNHAEGEQAEEWVMEEVPAIARLAAPMLGADAKLAIAGLSMGGYGALRLGAKYAGRFAAISAHSAFHDVAGIAEFVEEPLSDYTREQTADELSALFWLRRHRDQMPPVRFDCGTEDRLITGNRRLHRELESDGIRHVYEEFHGGHEWAYWREHVAETLRFVSDASVGRMPGLR